MRLTRSSQQNSSVKSAMFRNPSEQLPRVMTWKFPRSTMKVGPSVEAMTLVEVSKVEQSLARGAVPWKIQPQATMDRVGGYDIRAQ